MSKAIFLDANILQYLSNDKQKDSTASTLKIMEDFTKGSSFFVNFFQRYEFLRGIDDQKKQIKHLKILEKFVLFEATKAIFEFARILYLVYKKELNLVNAISDGDIILATSNLLTINSFILTANPQHFPSPWFRHEKAEQIKNKQGRYIASAVLATIDRELIIRTYKKVFKS